MAKLLIFGASHSFGFDGHFTVACSSIRKAEMLLGNSAEVIQNDSFMEHRNPDLYQKLMANPEVVYDENGNREERARFANGKASLEKYESRRKDKAKERKSKAAGLSLVEYVKGRPITFKKGNSSKAKRKALQEAMEILIEAGFTSVGIAAQD